MMKKGLVCAIVVLFIGVGVYPAVAVNPIKTTNILQERKIETITITDTSDSEEDCNCHIIDKYNTLRAKILLFKFKVISNIILLSRLGEIQEIKEDCLEILDDFNSNSPICNGLENFLDSLSVLFLSLEDKMDNLSEDSILYKIYYLYQGFILNFALTITLIGIFFDCWEWWPEPP